MEVLIFVFLIIGCIFLFLKKKQNRSFQSKHVEENFVLPVIKESQNQTPLVPGFYVGSFSGYSLEKENLKILGELLSTVLPLKYSIKPIYRSRKSI